MGTEDVKVTAINMYKYKDYVFANVVVVGSIPSLVRVFLCPCVGLFPLVELNAHMAHMG